MYSYSLAISARLWVVFLNLWEFCLIYVIYKVIIQTRTTIFDNSYLNKQYNEMGSKCLINIKKLLRKTRMEKSQIIRLRPPWFLWSQWRIILIHISIKTSSTTRRDWKIFRNFFDKCNFSLIANISLHRVLCGPLLDNLKLSCAVQ